MKMIVVHGPPCGGKTTYVAKHMESNDIVYDYDALIGAFSFRKERYVQKHVSHELALNTLDAVLQFLGNSKVSNAYIIKSCVNDSLREQLSSFNPEYIELNPGEEECLLRLEQDETRPEKEEWRTIIKEWFASNEMEERSMPKPLKKDYRHPIINVRSIELPDKSDEMIIEGRAIVFDQETVLFKDNGIEYKEIIKKGALDATDTRDCFLKVNHNDNACVARTKNGTLTLDIKDGGVDIRAKLANTTAGRDLYEMVREGLIDKMSFAFSQAEESFNEETHTWTVHKIGKLWDVAAVAHPAYEATELYARRYEEAEALRSKEVEALEAKKKRDVEDILAMIHSAK